MADTIYTQFLRDLANGTQDFDGSGTYVVLLLSGASTYAPNKDHKVVSDVFAAGGVEFGGTGYARQVLAGRTVTQDDAADQVVLDATDVAFGNLSGDTIKTVVVYLRVGADDSTPGDDRLVCAFDSAAAGLPLVTNGGPVTVVLDTLGLLTLRQG